jgi:hypothetical protein
MKYLKIQNQGELDIRLVALMGASTKTDDHTKIGQFGTGLKYAISFLIRNDIKFRLFSGIDEITFSTVNENINGKEFNEIYCNGKSMGITTQYGYQWKAWEAIREIWCNAKDENNHLKTIIDGRSKIDSSPNSTIFYIEVTSEIQTVLTEWDKHFINDTPIFENNLIAIYKNDGETLKIYKQGILIQDSEYYKSLFKYDLKDANLNELRQYQGYLSSDIGRAILGSNKAVIEVLLKAIQAANKKDLYEVKLDWSYLNFNKDYTKKIFTGWLFLHPQSDSKGGGKSVIVNETLFTLLSELGLPTEKIRKRSGGCYGGSGHGYEDNANILYKEVSNPELSAKIDAIIKKYDSRMKYIIAVPKDKEFEVLVSMNEVIFNSSLEIQSINDLESTVLIGIFHTQDANIYKAFKRLIKFVMANRNFKRILFGKV